MVTGGAAKAVEQASITSTFIVYHQSFNIFIAHSSPNIISIRSLFHIHPYSLPLVGGIQLFSIVFAF